MNLPAIEFIPLRPAVCSDQAMTLDVIMRITPPGLDAQPNRPSLNLGFVIDRSGSMGTQKKIDFARQAVCYAIEQLLPSDRISITIFDDNVETLVGNTLANNKASLTRLVRQIQPGSCTALHEGWVQGGIQTSQNLNADLNRIILLSDGLANVGETNPDVIATDVHGLAQRGVSTSTMGVGDDYDEDLLTAMATSGDGNYYYIGSPEQLPTIFEQELQGLAATLGTAVRLHLEPQGQVVITDVLNDLPVDSQGRFQLPNLMAGSPQEIVLRLQVPALLPRPNELCKIYLSWQDKDKQPQEIQVSLVLPGVPFSRLEQLPLNAEVQQQVALMTTARAKKEAVRLADQGDLVAAGQRLKQAKEEVLCFDVPMSAPEAAALEDLEQDLQERNLARYRKKSQQQVYSRSSRRSSGHTVLRYAFGQGPVLGDITAQTVDAIANSTDQKLSNHGGISAAIHRVAGAELLAACQQFNGCKVGEAKITPGFNLPAQWVIHTVCPTWQGGKHQEAALLARCYEQCLSLAVQNSIHSIAFPALGTGGSGFPVELAARIALETVGKFLFQTTAISQVLLVCADEKTLQAYQTEFERVCGWQ